MNQILPVVATIITFASFIYAIYANRKHSKLINYNREQAWEIYRQSSNVLAMCQALEKMNIENKDIAAWVARAETQSKELTFNSIRIIKRFEKKYDAKTIDKWREDGRLNHESHIQVFKSYIENKNL